MSSAPALKVEWVTDLDSFHGLGEEWERLVDRTDLHPSDRHCWYAAWWQAFGADRELAICTVRQEGALVGFFPMLRDGRGRTHPWVNEETDMTRPIASDDEAMEVLVTAVLEADRGTQLLERLPAEDRARAALEQAALAAGRPLLAAPAHEAPFIDTTGDFATWKEENRHRWESSLDRKRRKLERDYSAEFRLLERPQELTRKLDEGLRIEASGWKGRNGTAITCDPRSEDFYRRVAAAFAERDELRFQWIVLDGEPVAFSFNLLVANRLYSLKSGYDEEYRKLSPGMVMRLAIIEACFENGIASHELLGDAEGWKMSFATGLRPHVNLRIYPCNLRGRAAAAYRSRIRPRLRDAYRAVRRENG